MYVALWIAAAAACLCRSRPQASTRRQALCRRVAARRRLLYRHLTCSILVTSLNLRKRRRAVRAVMWFARTTRAFRHAPAALFLTHL